MRKNKVSLSIVILLSIILGRGYAQQVVTASGGDASGSGGQVNFSIGQVFYTPVTDAGGSMQQGVQAISISQALPVSLLSFQAVKQPDKGVLILWSTATEKDNDLFVVEKSSDGNLFKGFAQVKGKGNSNSINSYSAFDYAPFPGLNYYRLKQQDFDGTVSYSPVRVLSLPNNTVSIALSPNPTSGMLTLKTNIAGSKSYQILDMSGKLHDSKPITESNMQVDISHLPAAIYIVRILENNALLQTFKITKK